MASNEITYLIQIKRKPLIDDVGQLSLSVSRGLNGFYSTILTRNVSFLSLLSVLFAAEAKQVRLILNQ